MTCNLCGEKWTNGSFHVCKKPFNSVSVDVDHRPFVGDRVIEDVTKMIGTLQADRSYTAKTVYDKDGMHQLQPDGSVRHILYGEEETMTCTCSATCARPCKGACGCTRCHDDYQDFLSAE